MAILNLDLYSYELAMNTQVTMILPERRGVPHQSREGKKYPVLYLLHGHSQDHTSWLRLTRVEYYLKDTDVIVVMPNCNRGCWVDGINSHKYGSYLTKELPKILGNWFQVSSDPKETYIAGFSMGGYGALHAALSNPKIYGAVAALSASTDMHKLTEDVGSDAPGKGIAFPPFAEVGENFTRIFGGDDTYFESDYNLEKLAKKLQMEGGSDMRILSMCGDNDPLLDMNNQFADFMKAECPDITYEYKITEGIHDFYYWDREIVTALKYFGLL